MGHNHACAKANTQVTEHFKWSDPNPNVSFKNILFPFYEQVFIKWYKRKNISDKK